MSIEEYVSRREMIRGVFSVIVFSKLSLAQEDTWQKDLELYLKSDDRLTLGHILPPANDKTWIRAHDILSKAPTKETPLKVAEYFKAAVPDEYQRAWPEPNASNPTLANPVIVLFFVATRTAPAGDTTPWCAAFVNWCLNRAGLEGSKSAASQSFLGWGRPVWSKSDGGMPTEAETGDIALFRRQSDPTKGHVCFFKQVSAGQPSCIEVLGGNQIKGQGKNRLHLIDEATMRIDGDLELYSVRTAEGLRNAQR